MPQKLVIVGAGSAMFTQGIVRDWLQWKPAGDWELALVDNTPEILEATAAVGAICRAKSGWDVESDRFCGYPGGAY